MPTKPKIILLPKGYLSYSAISTWKRSREEYIRHYFYGEAREFDSKYIQFGKMFAENLEKKRRKHADPIIDLVLKSLPRQGLREFELTALLPSKWGNVPIMGKLDQYDPETGEFWEYKTGKRKWTQAMAQKHSQLKFYALMLWLKNCKASGKVSLIWIETEEGDEGEMSPTGRIEIYPVKFKTEEIMTFGKEIIKIAREISELYQQEINKIT